MTILDQFRCENSNISNFVPLKIANFATKIKIDHFSSFSKICIFFWQKMELWHTVFHMISQGFQNSTSFFLPVNIWYVIRIDLELTLYSMLWIVGLFFWRWSYMWFFWPKVWEKCVLPGGQRSVMLLLDYDLFLYFFPTTSSSLAKWFSKPYIACFSFCPKKIY